MSRVTRENEFGIKVGKFRVGGTESGRADLRIIKVAGIVAVLGVVLAAIVGGM